jgi:hypothetical protein
MGILIIILPLMVYLMAAFSVPKNLLKKPDDYFLAYKKVGTTAFSSSSVAYAFQVSTIYPFLLWGASKFFFVPFVNTVGWGLGILIFLLSFKKWKGYIGKDLTLHGFIGETYGKKVRVIASCLTITGLIGFVISETYFGSKVLLSIIENRNVLYLIIFGAILLVYFYITYGGQLSSIRTDQVQLMVSYLGVFGIITYLLYLVLRNGSVLPYELAIGLIMLLIYIPVILFIRKGRFVKISESEATLNKWGNNAINVSVVTLLVTITAFSIYLLLSSKISPLSSKLINLEGFGIPGLLSLIILPITYQFVDLTNWQRVLSVHEPEHDQDHMYRSIKKGLLIYALESPFTWVIFIFFGLLVVSALPHFTFQDLLVDLPKQLIHSHSFVQNIVGYVFILSIISIMLSTIDSFIVGIIFTYAYDVNQKTSAMVEARDDKSLQANFDLVTKSGRYFGLATATFAVLLFIIFDKSVINGGELFINLLLAFYSAQLSFFPLIFGKLFLKRQPSDTWAVISMLAGAISGVSLGVYSVIWNPVLGWYPIIVCFVLSSLIYIIGLAFSKNKKLIH